MAKKFDIFDIKSTSEEAQLILRVGQLEAPVVAFQAIIGRLYAKAWRFRKYTNKYPPLKKAIEQATSTRELVNTAYKEQHGQESSTDD